MPKEYKNILIHNMVNLGDVVFSTACLPILRAAYPSARITMLVRPKIADILHGHPCIDEVMEYDYKSKSDKLSVFRFAKVLKNKKFDLSISLDRKPRLAIATWWAGIPERVGPNKVFTETEWWRNIFNTKTISLDYELWTSEQYLIYQDIVARFTGRHDINGTFKPMLPKAPIINEKKMADVLKTLGNEPYIALCVKAEFPLKNWLPEYWAEMIKAVDKKYGAKMFITGIAKDREYAQNVIDMSGVNVANLCGKTEMLDLVAVYEQSKMMITTDLGAAHVAAARNTPVVGIYCCSSPYRTKPITPIGANAFVEVECRPCAVHSCDHKKCIKNLTVEMVMEKVDEVWKKLV